MTATLERKVQAQQTSGPSQPAKACKPAHAPKAQAALEVVNLAPSCCGLWLVSPSWACKNDQDHTSRYLGRTGLPPELEVMSILSNLVES